ncbi:hypothetical protein T265_02684 [Opisthorchis viverrini]|uniref:DNA-directed RNA polymerase n=1 Tax=Opisthorchis viverrini TaxID=6198 RepID=A0A074ZU55_OPIVI|nr:hypothetical protein T265_02684 [Opisthorchis viverrini]KER31008.1 hypothetical protein T265_02684 [Opisthorchis viverrini]
MSLTFLEVSRQGTTYGATLRLNVRLSINGTAASVLEIPCGEVPIMVLSRACNLSKLNRAEFPKHLEEEREIGGYFIVNGKERVLRLLIMTRRNFPLAIARPSFKRRGAGYSEFAIIMRCVREDEAVSAMVNKTEFEMFDDIRRGSGESLSLEETAMRILVHLKDEDYSSQTRALSYLGRLFRGRMRLPTNATDEDAGISLIRLPLLLISSFTYPALLQQSLLSRAPEIGSAMTYLLCTGNLPPTLRSDLAAQFGGQASGLSVPADNVNFLRLAAQFRAVHRGAMFTDIRTTSVRRLLPEAWGFICPVHTPDGAPCGLLNHLAEPVEAVCETPKHSTNDALAAWLTSNKLRSVELSRQLSGVTEAQNALPVLLDGRLVGWLSSLIEAEQLADELRDLKLDTQSKHVPYSLEIALVPPTDVGSQYPGLFLFTGGSRLLRPVKNVRHGNQPEGGGLVEWIGTFEQPYLDIAVTEEELQERSETVRSHMELTPDGIFSFVAGLTPYQDFNQSPRNMYQCQMAKQTMGHSCYTWRHRSDVKAYRLLTPQSPLVRTKTYVKYDIDHYPLGFNAIVAVMSYTGYDMEDAMVINKGSYERGLAGACIYKSEVLDLSVLNKQAVTKSQGFARRKTVAAEHYFGTINQPPPGLDWDGFPPVGTRLEPGVSALYCYTHMETQHTTVVKYEGGEQIAYVDAISLNGSWSHATITLRLPRPPDIGDKYSSRHGQKGINSLLVPSDEMPWSVTSGVVPDLIFNPHGFPTRMTMGMMVEFLAGKSAALTGKRVDATPFQWTEDNPPFTDYCRQLADCGFNYWGTEMMMSGCNGRQLEAHIYIGVVYYQRLRHMVADKYQVRSQGRFDPILRQPIKGRKVGGGIRLGEMERDCLLSQGLSFTLQDRMVDSNCDTVTMLACKKCGSLVHTDLARNVSSNEDFSTSFLGVSSVGSAESSGPFNRHLWSCRLCDRTEVDSSFIGNTKGHLKRVRVSAAFRYLVYELSCMNIQTHLTLRDLV